MKQSDFITIRPSPSYDGRCASCSQIWRLKKPLLDMGVVLRAKNATVNTKVLVHFFFAFASSGAPDMRDIRGTHEHSMLSIQKRSWLARLSTAENDSCKINKKLTRKNNHFDTPSIFNFFYLLSNHMCDFLYRKKKRSEICKWENRYAKHFPILWQFLNREEIGKIWKPAWRFVVGSIFTSFFYFLSWTACH